MGYLVDRVYAAVGVMPTENRGGDRYRPRVIVIGGDHRAALVCCLNEKLTRMGLVVTAADPVTYVPVGPQPVGPLFQTFGQILACPWLRQLLDRIAAF